MRPFTYDHARSLADATRAAADARASVLAGGTTLVDLMKLDVRRPERLIDISQLDFARIEERDGDFRIGALVTMARLEAHATLKRDYPVLTESLWLAASPQLRNVATLGGNVLQHTRCPYFRNATHACNKREPGSGCGAIDGINRLHAVLGVSEHCIASYPGDWAQALMALEATVEIAGPAGSRAIPIDALHRLPGDAPHVETTLAPGEIITHFIVPRTRLGRASTYFKVRDRESYAFANASAAVAVALDGDAVSDVRIALGGVAAAPWRAREAERSLRGGPLTPDTARRAGEIAMQGAVAHTHNAFKIPLGVETVIEALMVARERASA